MRNKLAILRKKSDFQDINSEFRLFLTTFFSLNSEFTYCNLEKYHLISLKDMEAVFHHIIKK